jgi:hypothetical protein
MELDLLWMAVGEIRTVHQPENQAASFALHQA